jgi:hypothetical protein
MFHLFMFPRFPLPRDPFQTGQDPKRTRFARGFLSTSCTTPVTTQAMSIPCTKPRPAQKVCLRVARAQHTSVENTKRTHRAQHPMLPGRSSPPAPAAPPYPPCPWGPSPSSRRNDPIQIPPHSQNICIDTPFAPQLPSPCLARVRGPRTFRAVQGDQSHPSRGSAHRDSAISRSLSEGEGPCRVP